jgi:hypothetical protein
MKHIPLVTACALGLLGLAGLTACADSTTGPGRTDLDGGSLGDTSLGAGDGGPGADGAAPSPRAEADYSDDVAGNRASCLNFVDDDANGQLDCEDPSCASAGANVACCVGSTAEACCVGRRDTDVVTSGACGTPCLEVGGAPLTPRLGQVFEPAALPATCGVAVDGDAFAPIGDGTSHGVLALPATYSPATARIVIEGRIGVADDTTTLAAAGFGVFTDQGLGAVTRPLVAVVASASADEARVIVGDRVVHVEPLLADCGRSSYYRLALEPTGSFRVSRRTPTGTFETIGTDFTYDVVPAARVAMLGQQPNPEVTGPLAWVSSLTVTQSGCDVLSPARGSTAVVEAGTHDVTGIAIFPQDAAESGYDALVSAGDQLYWMDVRLESGALTSISANPFALNFQPSALWGERFDRVEDVDVVLDGAEHRVFLAAGRAGEPLAIYTTTWDAAARELGPTPTMVVAASMIPGAISVDGPSALRRSDGIALAVRARFADGHTELRLVQLELGAELATDVTGVVGRDASGITTNGLLHASQGARPDAFDRDEVADPQLVELDGVVRVLYAGRRGTRWSLGLVVASPDFTHFAPVGSAPVLAPSGAGFDALGVSEPLLVRRDGADWLYFAGSNGARRGIGLATQPVLGVVQ